MVAAWRIGTSGWQYADWRGELYPRDVPQRLWLQEYGRNFDTVEVNNAFYRLPDRETFAGWRRRLPDGFLMAVKASRYLTHIKRLHDPAEPVARLLAAARGLCDALGPILVQLPPNLRADPPLLGALLACFPDDIRVAVEPRHESWWTEETRAVLTERGAALCWADRHGRPVTPTWRTADWGYLRMHQGTANPPPHYGVAALRSWAGRLAEKYPNGEVFVYFNNDPGAAAVHNARQFAKIATAA